MKTVSEFNIQEKKIYIEQENQFYREGTRFRQQKYTKFQAEKRKMQKKESCKEKEMCGKLNITGITRKANIYRSERERKKIVYQEVRNAMAGMYCTLYRTKVMSR